MLKTRALILFACIPALSGGAPLAVKDALGVLQIANRSPIALSPDGAWLAYTVEDLRRHEGASDPLYRSFSRTGVYKESEGCDVWITDTRSGESTNLTEGKGSNWGPTWSPDGKWLAFYSDRSGTAHLWLWEKATRKIKQLSDAIPHPYFNFSIPRWTPDSSRILIKILPRGMTVEQAARLTLSPPSSSNNVPDRDNYPGAMVTVYRSIPGTVPKKSPSSGTVDVEYAAFVNQYYSDLALIDAASGRIDRIALGIRPLGYWISPDGGSVAYTNAKGLEANTQQMVYSLEVVATTGGTSRILVPEVKQQYGISVRWSPDSQNLAYTTNGQTAKGDCFVVSVGNGAVTNLTPGTHPFLGSAYHPPYWDGAGDSLYLLSGGKVWSISAKGRTPPTLAALPDREAMEIVAPANGGSVWSPDGARSIIVMTRNAKTKEVGFFKISPDGRSEPLFELPISLRGAFDVDVNPGNGSLAFVSQDATHSDDIWLATDHLRSRTRVTRLNPQLDGATFGHSRLIEWTGIDGQNLHGALLLPADYQSGKRYPLIVCVYGGSNLSDDVFRFGLRGSGVDNMQLLATRGYAVLTPDAPLRTGTPMTDLLKTVLPGVDRIIEMGIADPDRLGVMGHSYGGYSTLSLIVQTTRFRAAVESAGPANLISFYGQMDPSGASFALGWSETGQGRMAGTPWQFRERYIENSPIFHLDSVQTPLLIVQGRLDHAVPEEQSDEVFIGLKRLGKEVEYAKYAGEEHWEGSWALPNVIDYWNRVIRWFDGHLKGDGDLGSK
jgi:dipeptidyl aminopeptidase/acylaminoacyl peptidase